MLLPFPFALIFFITSRLHTKHPLNLSEELHPIPQTLSPRIFFSGPLLAALFTSTSILPNFFMAASTVPIQICSLLISPANSSTLVAESATFIISCLLIESSSWSLELITTSYPAFANSIAIASPIPRLEPVSAANYNSATEMELYLSRRSEKRSGYFVCCT
jgi:hypothetical protein